MIFPSNLFEDSNILCDPKLKILFQYFIFNKIVNKQYIIYRLIILCSPLDHHNHDKYVHQTHKLQLLDNHLLCNIYIS